VFPGLINRLLPQWRREALRTTLWVVPAVMVAGAAAVFVVTDIVDHAAYRGAITLPGWVARPSTDAARQLLGDIAAAVITVLGVVFSVTIVALTLASQQFGPRMLRNFIRDLGTQVALGAFVSTFVYCVLALGAITDGGRHGPFVPDLSVTVSLGLLLVVLVVLIYFIHHIATTIQLPSVVAAISRDLARTIDLQYPAKKVRMVPASGPSLDQVLRATETEGGLIAVRASGYLQFVRYDQLVSIAESTDSVIRLVHRPGHFITAGLPLARVWPAAAAPAVERALHRHHVPGANRTLTQDPVFAIDQLVEIAIRALSPAVNDTFTALTCIDWLADGLCRISARQLPLGVHRDVHGGIRLIEPGPDYARIVNRASDKIRQASRNMPAVAIRQIDGLTKVLAATTSAAQRSVLATQAVRILHGAEADIPDDDDRREVQRRYAVFVAERESMEGTAAMPPAAMPPGATPPGVAPSPGVAPVSAPDPSPAPAVAGVPVVAAVAAPGDAAGRASASPPTPTAG
jgi:uncharacterized membrane protein